MKTLVLARHSKSDWNLGLPDFSRPLNPRGEEDAPRMGKLLRSYRFQPDLIVSSPANRAQSTARLIAEKLEYQGTIQLEEGIYGGGHGAVLDIIQGLPDETKTVMLFGHNPTTENLISFLLQMRAGIKVPTCGMACLDLNIDSWSQLNPLSVQMRWFLIPKLIKRFRP